VYGVDPLARQIGKSSEVLRPGQPLGLEAAHLAGRGSLTHWGPTANHPTHRRIAAQPLGIVHVFVARQPAEHRLPQQADQLMPAILTGSCVRQYLATGCGQSEQVIQLAISQQSTIGGDRRAAEPKHQAPVEIEPQRAPIRFTRRVPHGCPVRSAIRS
jgi:hypothetical protein